MIDLFTPGMIDLTVMLAFRGSKYDNSKKVKSGIRPGGAFRVPSMITAKK
jgi:hypothetical protein